MSCCKCFVVDAFVPDYGYVFDESQAARSTYKSRALEVDRRHVPPALFWINYYGPEWVKNIGAGRLKQLQSEVPVLEWLESGGVIFAIQKAFYDESDASHRRNQERLEKVLGLKEVHARFPNPGL